MNLNRFYVYIYLDPRYPGNHNYENYHFDFEPIYVGKGSGKRFKQHVWCGSKFLHNKLNKIKGSNLEPIIIKIENLSETKAFDKERNLINVIGRKDLGLGPLCNLADGGKGGSSGTIVSDLTRLKMSVVREGKHHTDDAKQKISKANSGRKMLYETKQKMIATKIRKFTFKVISPFGKSFTIKNLTEFCRSHNLNAGDMYGVANGKRCQHNGWRCFKIGG